MFRMCDINRQANVTIVNFLVVGISIDISSSYSVVHNFFAETTLMAENESSSIDTLPRRLKDVALWQPMDEDWEEELWKAEMKKIRRTLIILVPIISRVAGMVLAKAILNRYSGSILVAFSAFSGGIMQTINRFIR
jgi:hypothetical protein